MEVAVIGGGSLGLMWTARLMEVGFNVKLIVRTDEQKQRINSFGIRYTDHFQKRCYYPNTYTFNEYYGKLPTWTILAVKQRDLPILLSFLQDHMLKNGVVMTLQNGMGHLELLNSILTNEQIILGTTSDGALRRSVNEVERTGYGQVWIGQAGRSTPHQLVIDGLHFFQAKGIDWQWEENILNRLWRKCIVNCVINPLTAILAVENGKLLESPHVLGIMREIYEEAVKVSKACGAEISEDLWQEIEEICRITSTNRSSMLQDLDRRGKTEIDFINGYIVKRGKEIGLPTPWNEALVRLIHSKEDLN